MAYELGIIVIHGIGEQKAEFAAGFIAAVNQRLEDRAQSVCWKAVLWADLVEPQETDLLKRLSQGRHLDWQWLRRFVVHFLADAVAYQRVPGRGQVDGLYNRIHARVAERLTELRDELFRTASPNAADPPLLVIAHSLGGHIMSNYIWDHQRANPARTRIGNPPFVKAETLAGMITFGCNIPLFALALPEIVPIKIPLAPTASSPNDKPWLNMYDADDVLGYPLAPLSLGYEALVADHEVKVGGPLTAWNPASHNAYWTDNDVTTQVAASIDTLLRRIRARSEGSAQIDVESVT
jgi:alpha-beta hydrolase superfamily lysophospholipase